MNKAFIGNTNSLSYSAKKKSRRNSPEHSLSQNNQQNSPVNNQNLYIASSDYPQSVDFHDDKFFVNFKKCLFIDILQINGNLIQRI